MARIRDYAVTQLTTEAASITPDMPVYEAGDMLIFFLAKDAGRSGSWSVGGGATGWSNLGNQTATAMAHASWYKANVSSSETVPVFTQTDVDSMIGIMISIEGAPTSSPLDSNSTGLIVTDATGRPSVAGVTTLTDNCLIIYGVASDLGVGTVPEPGLQRLVSDDTGTTTLSVGWTIQKTAGATGARTFTAANPTGTSLPRSAFCIAIKDGSSGTILPVYQDPSVSMGSLIDPITGTVYPNGGGWVTNTIDLTPINGKTFSYDAISSIADSGVNPFHASAAITPAASATNYGGTMFNFGSAQDLDTGILIGTFRFNTPRDYIDTGFISNGGVVFVLGDASNNHAGWMIGAQRAKTTTPAGYNLFAIQTSQSTSTKISTSGSIDLAAVTKFQFGQMAVLGAGSTLLSMLTMMNKATISGGTSSSPGDFNDILSVVNGFILPFAPAVGASALSYIPIQFGGADPVFIDAQNFSLQFPERYNSATGILDFHVDENVVGLIFDGRAGDSIKIRNALVSSNSKWKFEFLSTVSTSATWDFSGLTIIGATPTLRNIGTSTTAGFVSMNFIDCDQIVQNSATITNCSIDGTLNTTAALLSNDPSLISGCSFVSPGTGHAIEITTPGTYSFTGNQFTGYGANGTTNAAIYNNSGGAVTLNIGGGGSSPTVRNGAGASTSVVLSTTLELTGLKNPTEVRVYNAGTTTALAGQENVTTGTFSTNIDAATYPSVDIAIISLGYQNIRLLSVDVTSDTSIPVQQTIDRQYNNP